MEIGLIGLGAMGAGIARRLLRHHQVVVHDRDPAALERVSEEGATLVSDLPSLVAALAPPRAIWIMVSPGTPTEDVMDELAGLLGADDVLVDGGNSHFADSAARADVWAERGIHLFDVGTSGGVGGAQRGYALMVGGMAPAVARLAPAFDSLVPDGGGGWGHVGPSGAGHFAKMVHNRIKHGMAQAYAEGLSALQGKAELGFDLGQITGIWRQAAMVRSALLELIHEALEEDEELGPLAPYIADSGRTRWTIEHAIDQIAEGCLDREQYV